MDLPKGKYFIEWRDTKNGQVAKGDRLKHKGGETTISSPEFAGDIALRIVAK